MVASVLIGMASTGPGIIARFLEGDGASAGFDGADGTDARHKAGNDWTMIPQVLAPADADEMVFKLSCHTFSAGPVWTWLGCYRSAQFAGKRRAGTYIGCGVISRDRPLAADRAATFITRLLERLVEEIIDGDEVSTPVSAVDENRLGVDQALVAGLTGEWLEGGLSAVQPVRLYVDFSGFRDKDEFDRRLLAILRDAQVDSAFGGYSELVIGNSPRLDKMAKSSSAYTVFSADEWQEYAASQRPPELSVPPAQPRVPPVDSPPSSNAGSPPLFGRKEAAPADGLTEARVVQLIHREMQEIERRHLENLTRYEASRTGWWTRTKMSAGGRRSPTFYLAGGALAILIIVFWAYYYLYPRVDTDHPAVVADTAATGSRKTIPGDDCRAGLGSEEPAAENEMVVLAGEKGCLEREIERRRARLREVNSRLNAEMSNTLPDAGELAVPPVG